MHPQAWHPSFPVLVSVWEVPVVLTPSIQMWIPHSSAGGPVVEGIFDQAVSGPVDRFIGCAPSLLSADRQLEMAREGMTIGLFLQELGYYGRASLDAIFVGTDVEDASLHWVECNGRWGGTSIPMTMVNRLTGDWKDHPFVVATDLYAFSDFPRRWFSCAWRINSSTSLR